jgi:hypothetical protein
MTEGEQIGYDVAGLLAEAIFDTAHDLAEADECVRILPVDLVVGDRGVVGRMEDDVLLEQYGDAVLDLAAVEVRGAHNGGEGLPSVARKHREDALGAVRVACPLRASTNSSAAHSAVRWDIPLQARHRSIPPAGWSIPRVSGVWLVMIQMPVRRRLPEFRVGCKT